MSPDGFIHLEASEHNAKLEEWRKQIKNRLIKEDREAPDYEKRVASKIRAIENKKKAFEDEFTLNKQMLEERLQSKMLMQEDYKYHIDRLKKIHKQKLKEVDKQIQTLRTQLE